MSFQNTIPSFTPEPLPLGETFTFIAVFWADVDTSNGQGQVYYREVTDTDLLNNITADIVRVYGAQGFSFFTAQWAYIVTWYQVGTYQDNFDDEDDKEDEVKEVSSIMIDILVPSKIEHNIQRKGKQVLLWKFNIVIYNQSSLIFLY